MIKIATIIGARPQFIKAAAVSRAFADHNNLISCESSIITEVIIHTGQHYDENMSKIFFDELHIPRPDYNLEIGSDSHGKQTGKMLSAIEEVLFKEMPGLVLTYGDTNSTLAGALAAVKLHIPTGHVEAGLRSYNRRMPEEINRILTDEISNILFCPTDTAVSNLKDEGIESNYNEKSGLSLESKVVMNVGDVMCDSILYNERLAQEKSKILSVLALQTENDTLLSYCLVTVHRPENTDVEENIRNIFSSLNKIADMGVNVIFPLHPRTRKKINEYGMNNDFEFIQHLKTNPKEIAEPSNRIKIIDPVGYLDTLCLEKNAKIILTDSGGMQKEAYLLGTPCITLRDETEWVETVKMGWNHLTGAKEEKIVSIVEKILAKEPSRPTFSKLNDDVNNDSIELSGNPYGDGNAAKTIVDFLAKVLK